MTHFTRTLSTGPALFSVSRTLRNAIGTMVKAVWLRWENKRQLQKINILDDHMLSDLGLTRGDVRAAIRTSGQISPLVRLKLTAVQNRATARALAEDRLARNRRKPGRATRLEDA